MESGTASNWSMTEDKCPKIKSVSSLILRFLSVRLFPIWSIKIFPPFFGLDVLQVLPDKDLKKIVKICQEILWRQWQVDTWRREENPGSGWKLYNPLTYCKIKLISHSRLFLMAPGREESTPSPRLERSKLVGARRNASLQARFPLVITVIGDLNAKMGYNTLLKHRMVALSQRP